MTLDDVKKIYAAQLLVKGPGHKPRQSTRTLVQAALHAESPAPYPLPPATKSFPHQDADVYLSGEEREASVKAEEEHLIERKMAMYGAVSTGEQMAFIRAKSSPGGTVARDAHHFAQMHHQSALWQEADKLVLEALGPC